MSKCLMLSEKRSQVLDGQGAGWIAHSCVPGFAELIDAAEACSSSQIVQRYGRCSSRSSQHGSGALHSLQARQARARSFHLGVEIKHPRAGKSNISQTTLADH
eukprot:6455872-Prymnesium_polylepis.1